LHLLFNGTLFDMTLFKSFLILGLLAFLSGCAVVAVADAAVTVTAVGVKTAVKAVGTVADAVTPEPKKQ
jgi:hypothetical protein